MSQQATPHLMNTNAFCHAAPSSLPHHRVTLPATSPSNPPSTVRGYPCVNVGRSIGRSHNTPPMAPRVPTIQGSAKRARTPTAARIHHNKAHVINSRFHSACASDEEDILRPSTNRVNAIQFSRSSIHPSTPESLKLNTADRPSTSMGLPSKTEGSSALDHKADLDEAMDDGDVLEMATLLLSNLKNNYRRNNSTKTLEPVQCSTAEVAAVSQAVDNHHWEVHSGTGAAHAHHNRLPIAAVVHTNARQTVVTQLPPPASSSTATQTDPLPQLRHAWSQCRSTIVTAEDPRHSPMPQFVCAEEGAAQPAPRSSNGVMQLLAQLDVALRILVSTDEAK